MKKTISELYYFHPDIDPKLPNAEEFRKITAEFLECANKIEELLGKENTEIFRRYENLGKQIAESLNADAFARGYSLASRLTLEALENK